MYAAGKDPIAMSSIEMSLCGLLQANTAARDGRTGPDAWKAQVRTPAPPFPPDRPRLDIAWAPAASSVLQEEGGFVQRRQFQQLRLRQL